MFRAPWLAIIGRLCPKELGRKVTTLVSGVEAVASRAQRAAALLEQGQFDAGCQAMLGPNLPRGSYTAKFLGILARTRRMKGAPTQHQASATSMASARGVKRPLARLSGVPERRLTDVLCAVPRGEYITPVPDGGGARTPAFPRTVNRRNARSGLGVSLGGRATKGRPSGRPAPPAPAQCIPTRCS